MTRARVLLLLCAGLAGCGVGDYQDLKEFVRQSGANLRGRVAPLPEIKAYEPFPYQAQELQDPFRPRAAVASSRAVTNVPSQASELRRREALEAFPLDSLKMVGTLQDKHGKMYALVRTPENNLYQVRVGNYVGQNYGIVSAITETSVSLKEVYQDTTGEWLERTSGLQLQDEEESRK